MKKENDANSFDAENSSSIIENENLKSRLKNDFGAMFGETIDLPIEIQNQFLSEVLEYENAAKDAKKISVYDFIGKPIIKSVETLTEIEISTELEKLNILLSQYFLALDCICKYPDTVIYKFITQELFLKEIDDIRIPGLWCNFIYEEYYPNHKYDIKRQCEDLIQQLFSANWRYINSCIYDTIKLNGKPYQRNNLDEFYNWFPDQWKTATVTSTSVRELFFDDSSASAKVSILLSNKDLQSDELLLFRFGLVKKYDWWMINSLDIEVDQSK